MRRTKAYERWLFPVYKQVIDIGSNSLGKFLQLVVKIYNDGFTAILWMSIAIWDLLPTVGEEHFFIPSW